MLSICIQRSMCIPPKNSDRHETVSLDSSFCLLTLSNLEEIKKGKKKNGVVFFHNDGSL